jgi:hypothetical protein
MASAPNRAAYISRTQQNTKKFIEQRRSIKLVSPRKGLAGAKAAAWDRESDGEIRGRVMAMVNRPDPAAPVELASGQWR